MLNFAGADQRQDDLFANENFFSRGKSALKGLKVCTSLYFPLSNHADMTVIIRELKMFIHNIHHI